MSEDKRPKNNININKYNDPTGLAAKNLNFGLWAAKNRKRFYKISIIALAVLGAGFLLYSGYGYFNYFVFGLKQDKILDQVNSGIDLANYRLQNKPIDLQVGATKVISGKSGLDFVVILKNSNAKQFANFDYCFVSTTDKACGSSFILPNEEKNILILNSPLKLSDGQVSFKLNNLKWQKLNAGDIPDWNVFKLKHLAFIISQPTLISYTDGPTYLEFEIINDSAFGYFQVPLNITISQGSEIVAVNRYVISDLNSLEKKSIRLAWPEALNLGGTIKVTPDLNIIDNNIYKPFGSN